jgi:hypothetical protein
LLPSFICHDSAFREVFMNRMQTAGLALLIASVGGNALLARTLAHEQSNVADSDGAAALGAAAEATPPGEMAGASASQPVACGSGVDVLEAEVAEKSAALRVFMPAELLFASGQPNPAAERLMAPIVTRALGALGPTREQHLRCRDVACQVVFRESAALHAGAWESALAGDPNFAAWVSEYGLSEARPVDDAETKTPEVERTIYFKLRPKPSEGEDLRAREMRLKAAEAAQKAMAAQPSPFIQRPSGHRGGKDAPARR